MPDAREAARLELMLSAATVRYVTYLVFWRIDPSTVSEELLSLPRRPDAVNLLWDVAAVSNVGHWLDGQALAWPQYRALRRALAGLRTMPVDEDLVLLPDDRPGSTVFDPELEAAVMSFQRRHGLDDDGVVGRRSRTMLNMTVAQRIRQVELNMECLLWLQEDLGSRYI